jgi:hypothetical protein
MLPRRTPLFRYVTLYLAAGLLAGCQTAPVQEMSDARQAISVARDAGAEDFAADDLKMAVDSLESAERFLSRREYENARRDALQAKENALTALSRSAASRQDPP